MTAIPVRRSIRQGIPKPTASTSAPAASRTSQDRVDGDIEQRPLVETRDGALGAVVDPQPLIDRAGEQFGPAQVDADGAPRRHGRHYMQCSMPDEPRDRAPGEEPPYRVYRGEQNGRSSTEERPYTVVPVRPARAALPPARRRGRGGPGDGRRTEARRRRVGRRATGAAPTREPGPWRERITARRVLKYLAIAIVAWLLLSLVLFLSAPRSGPARSRTRRRPR